MIDVREFFVVQTRSHPEQRTTKDWVDEPQRHEEEGPAFDRADYLRERGDTEARVVRRWR